jgi:O-antigen/teichoic acid export membrane protein
MVVSVGVLVAVAVGINGGQSESMLSGAVLLVPSYLCYQYARALAFSRGFVITATVISVTVLVLTVGGLTVDRALTPAMDANHVLLVTGGAYVVAGGIATWFLASELGLSFHHLRLYRTYASVSRWTLLGVVCFEMMNRMPNFAVSGQLGVAALGRMSATQLPTRVPALFVMGLQPALRNDLASLRERGEWARFTSHCALASFAALMANLLWAVPIGLAWLSVTNLLFHGQFADDLDLGLLWIASQSLASSSFVAATAFQVCGEFRRIGLADVAGALSTTTGVVVLMPVFGIAGAIAALIIGQACYLLALLPQWSRLRDTFPVRTRETVNASV